MNYRFLLFALGSLLCAVNAQGQYEIKASNFNAIYTPYNGAGAAATPFGPPVGTNQATVPATLGSNYQGAGNVSGSSNINDVTPADGTPGTIPTAHADRFPANPEKTVVLLRCTVGGMFASGVPRYFMGDQITPPLVQADGVTPAGAGYWRAKPVLPDEPLSSYWNGSSVLSNYKPIPVATVTVNSAATDRTTVTISGVVPPELVVGATILGEPITSINGTTVTLAGNSKQNINSSTNVSITPMLSYYYSPHSEKVYASQAGRTSVMWVTLNPTGNGGYETLTETFAVSSNTVEPVRTIFWSEGSFDGPKVQINDNRITTVSPAYYGLVPKAVALEVEIPGYTPITPNLSTLSFDRFNGIGQLHAYNVEGRVLIEYLGNIRLPGNIYESLGTDVVEIKRVPTVTTLTVNLGEELQPHDFDGLLRASPVLSGAQQAATYYGTVNLPDGTQTYFAERETSAAKNPDNGEPASSDAYNKVVLYWLETGEFNIQWPKYQDRYWQRWSPILGDYAHYTVGSTGSTPATGISFTGNSLPQVVYEDAPTGKKEANIDLATQRFFVTFAAGADKVNRALLKFSSGGVPWYVNVYTQAEDRAVTANTTGTGTTTVTVAGGTAQLEAGMVVTGSGISGYATIIKVLSATQVLLSQTVAGGTTALTYTVQADAGAPITATAQVGNRIAAPAGHEIAGGITGGTGYYPAGYLNPFTVGVEAANAGAIIPVNALPTDNVLTVRWFKKVAAPSASFQDIYVPGKVGRYTVSYPSTPVNATGSMAVARAYHISSLLSNGKVLVAGGTNGSTASNGAELYDAASGTWTATGNLATARYFAAATVLSNGKVMAVGGYGGSYLGTAEIYDPAAGTWSAGATLTTARINHTVTALANNKVLVAGGSNGGTLSSAQIYEANGLTFSSPAPPAMGTARYGHSAVLLPNGKVLIVGGTNGSVIFATAELYNPATNTWAPTGSLATARAMTTATLLANGKVLVTGGQTGFGNTKSAEIYDPATGLWAVAGSMAVERSLHTATLLADGRVLVAGGNPSWWTDFAVNRVEIYDPVANTWSGLDSLGTARAVHQASLLGNGKVLVSGGYPYTASAELIDPAASFAGDTIVIASGVGSDDLAGPQAEGSIYYQNNSALPGYNPNEEHALMLGGRAYALRDDLNVTSGASYTSHPYVLLAYTDVVDERPAIRAFRVEQTSAQYDFEYTATAGTLLVKPYPLPLLPAPLVGTVSKDVEFSASYPDYSTNRSVNTFFYDRFTFNDRKGFTWVYRGPHANGSPALGMKLYYKSQAGFYLPGSANPNPTVGTILPFLRNSYRRGQPLNINSINWGNVDEPLTIRYTAAWPTDAPEMRIGETLTLPKFGLPQVRGQASAEVFYQQSLAVADTGTGNARSSVILHDPTREKGVPIDKAGIGLTKLPADLKTTSYQGRTYFQGLPPHLQKRFYFDPLRGTAGALILSGEFHDELAGEDYLDLNVLSPAEIAALKGLLPVGTTGKSQWDAAINDLLLTYRYTWTYNAGRYTQVLQPVSQNVLSEVASSDTAVDSYALTATGQGAGYVTLVFGNGNNSDVQPVGDPVVVQVIKVAPQLYTGDLKVVQSSNPLDEQVTLRHSADFAAHPEDYEFEWRWTTGESSAPATYTSALETKLGDPAAMPFATNTWSAVRNPKAVRPAGWQYGSAVPFPRSENVHPVNYVLDAQSNPTDQVIAATSYTDSDIAANFPAVVLRASNYVNFGAGVPGTIVFSADVGDLDGFIVYINGRAALAHQSPAVLSAQTNASTGLSPTGLSKQFAIAPSFFSQGYYNTVEVAVYTGATANTFSTLNFKLESAVETDAVTSIGSVWQPASDPTGKNTNMAIVGGSPTNPFGGPQFVLNDRWFTMRYRAKPFRSDGTYNAVYHMTGGTPSRWLPPQFVEGWIKRVLAAINPFEQRVKDLFNNQVNTDVSVLTQAGTKWEGDIALTLDNINDVGLIAIYETVLNRAKSMSVDANTNDPDTNNALLLAAGYLNDLYTIIGNEAFADAANPTISLDDQSTVTEVNTSRFSFEGQVTTSLSEEMALLRGRDDLFSPGVMTAPAYNRLYWNYTHGINSGEVLYAVNYNIKEKVGSSTANGVIDEADAQRMFPQGHGDAYGHYLTALTGYYRLLTHPNFTWPVRAEAVTVAGQPVTVDFMDERKFAAAAGLLARTAQQVCSLSYRESYKDDPGAGWSHFRDDTGMNPQTQNTRRQGLDEWASRSAQGALYHWVVANAMVPDVDTYHQGVQKIDRTTVLEIPELVSYATSFQTTVDNANAHLNPLGLSPGAIAFDISPTQLQAGQSHFEQIYDRALRSLTNAAGSFNQAARMTRLLRNQENQTGDYNTVLSQQERAYVNQLIDIYGRPYSGEVGAGKMYAQGYEGPDLLHWFIVDRPNDLVNTSGTFSINISEAREINWFSGGSIQSIVNGYDNYTGVVAKTVTVQPSQFVQYNDVWKSALGSRPETGDLQDALQEAQRTWLTLSEANIRYKTQTARMRQFISVFNDLVKTHKDHLSELGTRQDKILELERLVRDLDITAASFDLVGTTANDLGEAIAEFMPQTVGLATDVTSPARGATRLVGAIIATVARAEAVTFQAMANFQRVNIVEQAQELDAKLTELGFNHEEVQMAYEFANLYREVTTHSHELMQLSINHQRALENVRNVMATGLRILEEREIFRQRAAAIIQGYRTKDLTFRVFRNEALEQYRSLFDLASRYTYLAAKSYDYETGLLGTSMGQIVFKEIVGARSLGDVQAGTPLSTVSSLGDSGLAGVMAKLFSDFSVAEGRLGINNPDQNGTVFSLRSELFRLLDDPNTTADDDAWRQTLEQHIVANVMTDSDVATYCRNIKKPDGAPVPGFVIPFSTTIQHAKNLFGLDLAAGDHNYTPSNYATKIFSVGVALPGYVGMDTYAAGNMGGGAPASGETNALSATPYCYLIPCGNDYMLAPPLGDTNTLRTWTVHDQALPLPFNLGANDFNSTQFFSANGTLSEQPWILRKHQAFRPVGDATFFYSSTPAEFTNTRLVGRSVWNSQWKLVIPAYTLLNNEQNALDRFTGSVKDIQIFLRTYSHSGN